MIPGEAAAVQLRLSPSPITPRARREYRHVARWWELEAQRSGNGEECAARSRRYAASMRWAAELVGWFGEGSWLELNSRYSAAIAREKKRRVGFLALPPRNPGA